MADHSEHVVNRDPRGLGKLDYELPWTRMAIGDTFEVVPPDGWRLDQLLSGLHTSLHRRHRDSGERHAARKAGCGVIVTRVA